MKFNKLPLAIAATALTVPTLAVADHNEIELDEAQLYFELNDTDGDLGIHGKADGDAWKRMKIEGPNDRTLLNINVRSRLRRQGLTELFFESAEPTFDELLPEVFFRRFPEGAYEWEGLTLDYLEIEGEVYLSQRIPAAPVVVSVGGGSAPVEDEDGELGCWGEPSDDDVLIVWEPVTRTHAELGSDLDAELGDDPELGENPVIYYEFVAEIDGTEFKSTALIPPDPIDDMSDPNFGKLAWTISEEFVDVADGLLVEDEDEFGNPIEVPVEEIKFEIIVRVESGVGYDDDGERIDSQPGNQSAVESCFDI